MVFCIHVICGPYSQQGNLSALLFCKAALARNHQIHRVFFSGDGVYSGNHLAIPPQDEINLHQQWQQIAAEHEIELVICVAAGLRRGVINQSEASRHQKPGHNLSPEFILSGLGQLIESSIESDRVITFGGR